MPRNSRSIAPKRAQTFWSNECPLFDQRLNVFFRLAYSSTCVSYLSTGLSVIVLNLVPVLTILFGWFPIALNFWSVVGITAYYISLNLLSFYCHSWSHYKVCVFFSCLGSFGCCFRRWFGQHGVPHLAQPALVLLPLLVALQGVFVCLFVYFMRGMATRIPALSLASCSNKQTTAACRRTGWPTAATSSSYNEAM